jgi:hypothetical protein
LERKDVTVNAIDWQTEEFERHRPHLRAVAYRMLGSLSDADDVVQEAWLRLAMKLFGRWNWWLPESVAKIVRVEPSPLEGASAPALRPAAR